jgi:FMN-dependent oxidoreductase (nitrilotriacetate monooxygenase family)
MTKARKLRFGAFMSVPSCHPTGWRHPDAVPETDLSPKLLLQMARTAERGKLDCMFFQDSVAIPGAVMSYGGRTFREKSGRQAHIEPMTAIAAIGAVTKNLGLISTCTTSYNEPYNVARRFLTIDHISGGRAGWNLVTSQAEDEAVNFGRDQHFEHGIRYERASEFHDVVVGLWDSWEDDAFLRDKATGQWFDYDKMHILNHKGEFFNVRGPLNVARSPQGRPVVAQAGSSDVGMDLAARTADLIFTAQDTIPEGRAFREGIHARMEKHGRRPDEIRVFPGIQPIVGRTMAEAEEKYLELRSLVDDGIGIAAVARLAGGVDIFSLDPDGPLPPLKPSNAARARQERIIALGKRGLSIRDIGRILAMSQTHRVIWGTPQSIADDLTEWYDQGAADGFNLLFAHYPKPLEEWVDMVIPELQRRGVFRTEYESTTFRGNLGVPIPENRFVKNRKSVAVAASND